MIFIELAMENKVFLEVAAIIVIVVVVFALYNAKEVHQDKEDW